MKVSKSTFLMLLETLFLVMGTHLCVNAQNRAVGIETVVIDPGHGGKDPGAVGRRYKEKDITLDAALRLGELIKQNYPDIKVVYTRKTDVFIPVIERGQIANKAGADLFISLHINSTKTSSAMGSSTYVMGVNKTGKSMEVAMKENDVILYENDYKTKYQGYVPGSAESFIIFSLMSFSDQTQSGLLADLVQKNFAQHTPLKNRGVHQDGFLVLWYAAMPSILAEFGFISNPAEERYIGSDKGRAAYAQCLFNAFSEYKSRCEGRGTLIVLDNEKTKNSVAATVPDQTKLYSAPKTPNRTQAVKTEIYTTIKTPDQTESTKTPYTEEDYTTIQVPDTYEGSQRTQISLDTSRAEEKQHDYRETETFPTDNVKPDCQPVIYRVQIASSERKLPKNSVRFGIYRGETLELIINDNHKYYVGNTESFKEALSLQTQVRRTIRDAFIVPFLGETPITMEQARERDKK